MTTYPTTLDAFVNPTEFDQTPSATVPHAGQHANLHDAVAAIETKVGVDNSAVTTTIDYLVKNATTGVATKVAKAGDTMTGFLTLHADPDTAMKAATKQYVDTMLPKSGGTMTGALTLSGDPTTALHAATKQYVDARAGFQIPLFGVVLGFSPADSTTYFHGMCAGTVNSTYGNAKIAIPRAGTIKRVDLKIWIRGTLASAETVSHYIRLNDTTDLGQIDTTYDAANRDLSATGLTQAVVAGDFIALKIVTPAWVTNPTNVQIEARVFIE